MSAVDVSGPTEDARREAEKFAETDSTYSELMLTYVELGELLDSGRADPDYVAECRDLVETLVALDRVFRLEFEERWAIWCARTMDIPGGDREQSVAQPGLEDRPPTGAEDGADRAG